MKRQSLPGAVLVSSATAASGLLTYAFLIVAARALDPKAYGRIGVLWGSMFIGAIVLFRPLEQTASRAISARLARGEDAGAVVRSIAVAASWLIAGVAVGGALAWHELRIKLFDGSAMLTVMLFVGVALYGVSYVVRGIIGGVRWFGGYALLLLSDAGARLLLAVPLLVVSSTSLAAVAVVAAGAAGAVAPLIVGRAKLRALHGGRRDTYLLSEAAGFAIPAALVAACDQLIVNGPPLLVALDGAAPRTVGLVFGATMLVRAPVYVFQGLAASLLPNFTHLRSTGAASRLARALLRLVLALAAIGATVVIGTAAVGQQVMSALYGGRYTVAHSALVLLATAVASYLIAATLSQAILATGRAWIAAASWLSICVSFITMFVFLSGGELSRIATAMAVATGAGVVILTAALVLALRR